MVDKWYEVQWLVPAKHAIGRKAYWIMVESGKFKELPEAEDFYGRCRNGRPKGEKFRIVEVKVDLVMES